jgi:type II secretory pathway pseudopilin PulG
MVALLVAMSVMAIMMGAALPAWNTLAQREREAELVFRGEQYGRAIGLYQRKFANAPVPSIDVLVDQRFLRRKYKDPITNDEFQVLSPGTALPGQPGQPMSPTGQQTQPTAQAAGGRPAAAAPQGGRAGSGSAGAQGGRAGGATAGVQGGRGGVAAGIVGVTSKSSLKSLRLYNGRDTYNQWIFMPVAQSARVGVPGGAAGVGSQGGRGADGRGGRGGIDGRGGQPARGVPQGGRAPVQPPTGGGVIR